MPTAEEFAYVNVIRTGDHIGLVEATLDGESCAVIVAARGHSERRLFIKPLAILAHDGLVKRLKLPGLAGTEPLASILRAVEAEEGKGTVVMYEEAGVGEG